MRLLHQTLTPYLSVSFFRAEKAESIQQQQQHQPQHRASHQQQQQQHQSQRTVQRQQVTVPQASVSPSSERQQQIRQRQSHQRTYQDEEYEPASEIESDRQQRVYRGQPSTVGQVARDRDGLRRNIISVSVKTSCADASTLSDESRAETRFKNRLSGRLIVAKNTSTSDIYL